MNVDHVVVAVPARDEAACLSACLRGLNTAAAHLLAARGITVQVVVALDGCTDASLEIARDHGAWCVELAACGVGAARDAAVRAGLACTAVDPERVWVANTDADTLVPRGWLTGHVAAAEAGADLVLGTVEPTGLEDEVLLAAWHAAHRLVEGHDHVHGANLGVRGSTYLALGGFGPLRLHEDADLVERARLRGYAVAATDTVRVATSGRAVGRVTGGFADYLAALRAR